MSDAEASTPTHDGRDYSGALLKQLREEKGLTLQEISEKTKIGARALEALEAENFSELPNARVYIRGFVRCYAEEVGLDPDAVQDTYLPRWHQWAEGEDPQQK